MCIRDSPCTEHFQRFQVGAYTFGLKASTHPGKVATLHWPDTLAGLAECCFQQLALCHRNILTRLRVGANGPRRIQQTCKAHKPARLLRRATTGLREAPEIPQQRDYRGPGWPVSFDGRQACSAWLGPAAVSTAHGPIPRRRLLTLTASASSNGQDGSQQQEPLCQPATAYPHHVSRSLHNLIIP
jgi:hypothetical protein